MAKKLSANPAEAHRKQQRQKELKRNKDDRKKSREIAIVKKDTQGLEAEIRKLSERRGPPPSAADQARLAEAKAELARIVKAKTEYVAAHPEHRKFVFPERQQPVAAGPQHDPPGLYRRDGKLKHPERSAYYDPVFNPFGAPPPGMPYREREPTEEERRAWMEATAPVPMQEDDSQSDSDDDEDDDEILMPEGAPPPPIGAPLAEEDESSSDDSDGIELPEGPPPPRPGDARVHIQRPQGQRLPPRPNHQHQHPQQFRGNPRHPQHQPRPPPGAPTGPRNPHALPSRPPPPVAQDPLSDAPGSTFQSHQAQRAAHAHQASPGASVSAGPSAPTTSAEPAFPGAFAPRSAAATISAAPQLRDLKKEATAFMPTAMRKKLKEKEAQKSANAGLGLVNAAPSAAPSHAEEGGEGEKKEERASLMGALKGVGIGGVKEGERGRREREDYERFREDMKEFL